MDNKEWMDFRLSMLKVHDNRVHKITGSLGVYDAYKFIRKNKWLDLPRSLTEHEFYSIIRKVNEYLAENLIKGEDVFLPQRMGNISLRKFKTNVSIKDGKLKTNKPIDWDKTLKLWYEDEEAFNNKSLVRDNCKELFSVYYDKREANYKNQDFYVFKVNRELKKAINKRVKNGELDAFEI